MPARRLKLYFSSLEFNRSFADAVFHLVEHLRECRFALFDIQMLTPVTKQLGGVLISREEYLERLQLAVSLPCVFGQ
jgi:Leu/Phe-tRNA-protein transferase